MYALDFETDGVNPLECRTVTVALVEVAGDGTVVRARGAVVNSGVEIPEEAAAIHGFTTERVKEEGRQPEDVFPRLITLLEGASKDHAPLVIFNSRFDWPLLHAEAERLGLDVPEFNIIDPFIIDKKVDKWRKGKRTLGVTAEHYGVELTDAHSASADAIAAALVARAIGRTYPLVGDATPAELQPLQAEWFLEWSRSFNQYLTKQGKTDLVAGTWPR